MYGNGEKNTWHNNKLLLLENCSETESTVTRFKLTVEREFDRNSSANWLTDE